MDLRPMLHEVWEDVGDAGESLPSLCLAGPLGDGSRGLLGPEARLLATFEARSHHEAMTTYYRLMGRGDYTTDQPLDLRPYPDEWLDRR